MEHNLLTTKQAASILGVSVAFLERDRWAGASIPFIRIGSRTVRYRQEDLTEYILAQRNASHLTASSGGNVKAACFHVSAARARV